MERGFRTPPLKTVEDIMIEFHCLVLKFVRQMIKTATNFQPDAVEEIIKRLIQNHLLTCENENLCIAALELMMDIASEERFQRDVTDQLHKLLLAFDWLEFYEDKSIAVSNLLENLLQMLNQKED